MRRMRVCTTIRRLISLVPWSFALIVMSGTLHPLAAQLCEPSASRVDATIGRFFADESAEGTVVLLDMTMRACLRFNPERARTRFLPASTFKIFNTMVALDEGSIGGPQEILKWDGVDRGSAGWNADQDLRTAFRRSTVWFYQELARRTGEAPMRKWLERESYGNADPSGGMEQFWLSGALRISADEQVAFLDRLLRRRLSFSPRAQDVAAEVLVMEQTPEYTLGGKTGWTQSAGHQLGWYVGFVERAGSRYAYALNLESPDPAFPMREARERLMRRILTHLGLLPPQSGL